MALNQSQIDQIKVFTMEEDYPYNLTDDLLNAYFSMYGNVREVIYWILIMKSRDETITIEGLTAQQTVEYFKRLALPFKPNNTGVLTKGAGSGNINGVGRGHTWDIGCGGPGCWSGWRGC